jgi:hypothetical protein
MNAGIRELPQMVKVNDLAASLGLSAYHVAKLCRRLGVEIVRAGGCRQRMVDRGKFEERWRRA